MIVDILFVVAVIGILIAIYKTKFSQKKSPQQLKAQLLKQTQSLKPTKSQQKPYQPTIPQAEWTGQQSSSQSQQQSDDDNSSPQNDRKQLYKQQKRRQKQQRKQAQQHFLTQQKQKRQQYQKQQQDKQRQEEQKRLKQEEYIEQMREEQRKRKEQEFNKWKDMFAVQQSGVTKQSQAQLQKKQLQLQQTLTTYLKTKKLTLLQDASHKFQLQTKDLVEKIKKLEQENKISGVFDERGKFLFIQEKEWDAIKSYIVAKGRLKKFDMMTECARIVKIPEDGDEELLRLVNQVEEK